MTSLGGHEARDLESLEHAAAGEEVNQSLSKHPPYASIASLASDMLQKRTEIS